jgi:hypothetical protein
MILVKWASSQVGKKQNDIPDQNGQRLFGQIKHLMLVNRQQTSYYLGGT